MPAWLIVLTFFIVLGGCLSGLKGLVNVADSRRTWRTYELSDAGSRVEAPYEPLRQEVPRVTGAGGTLTYFFCDRVQTREEFLLAYFDLDRDPPADDPDWVVETAVAEFRAVRDRSREIGRHQLPAAPRPTWELDFERGRRNHMMQVIRDGRRVYVLWVTAVADGELSVDATRFVDSFVVTR